MAGDRERDTRLQPGRRAPRRLVGEAASQGRTRFLHLQGESDCLSGLGPHRVRVGSASGPVPRAGIRCRRMNPSPNRLAIGTRVTVTQQVQNRRWTTEVTGTVVAFEQRKTGSWYAHGKDDKLWLDRLVLEKADGEIVTVNLDRYSHLERVEDTAADAPEAPSQGVGA